MFKKLSIRLSYANRHHDYYKWIGPELGKVHFIYTDTWYNAIIDWILFDVFNNKYSYNYDSQFGWHKVYEGIE